MAIKHALRRRRFCSSGATLKAHFLRRRFSCRAKRGAPEDESAIEGTLFDQIKRSAAFVARNLHTTSMRQGIRRQQVPEVPLAAVREAVINAVAHRDYRSTAPIQIRLSDQCLEVWNPGLLPAPLTPAALRAPHPSVPTNPLVARALYLAGYVQEWGSGTLRIIEAMHNAGLAPPSFLEEGGGIKVALPLRGNRAELPLRQSTALRALPSNQPFKNADYARRAAVSLWTANADLAALAAMGLVTREGQGRAIRWRKA